MASLEETIYINRLLDIYGTLLSPAQREIMVDYFEYNLSLSEIAENRSSSRTAVSDAIRKGGKKLAYYEDQLHILKEKAEVALLLKKIKENGVEESVIEQIERIINHGL
ncbi:MAG TPA: sigma factor-like helix-turn-helix DNA-binding protein [Bacilli bacterium]|nr:sigma factor-like helix-turn-helix DNA-binding protein [Bacilli bacterium]